MSLTAGTRLGSYHVTALLGAGGMGEVYRARDPKLEREVAIKILPALFAADAERVARFEREARVLASLNHPHIAAIHGLEEAGGQKLLVMELVEGETLAEKIAGRPVPIADALAMASQIADALEAAHDKGVVHRDLKPANIKVTDEGRVKVLDFGLAKALDPVTPAESHATYSPTLSVAATRMGMILGTAPYMSPEQAKGKTVDKRTDIFAFGSVLYEMLTGRPAFTGDDIGEILARVIERDPDWTRLPAGVPPRVEELLRRCLEKDPRRRRRDAGDVRLDLEQALSAPPAAPTPAVVMPNARRTGLPWMVAGLFAVALAVAMALPYLRTPAPAPEMRVDIVTPATPDPFSFAISPDGRQLVFVAVGDGQPQLWVRPLDTTRARPLAGTEGASYPFWSPDSRSVGFYADARIKRIDISGGLPQSLTPAAVSRGATWSPDGVIIFSPSSGSALMRIPAAGGDSAAVTTLTPRQTNHRFPQVLPDGRQFLFYAQGADQGIYLGSLDAPDTKRLTQADTAGAYLPPGWLLFGRQGILVARRFDLARGELTGEPVTIADGVGFDSGASLGAFSVSPTGLVTYRATGTEQRQLTWFDRSGKAIGTMGARDDSGLAGAELSPDGRRVAVERTVQGNTDIWLVDAARTIRFTFDAGIDRYPRWSADGSLIGFSSYRKGPADLYRKPSNGAGSEEPLLESPLTKTVQSWSPTSLLLYLVVDPKTARDLWVLPLDGSGKPSPFLNSAFDERGGQFSPDGRWVAYQSDESGRVEVYVRPFPGPGGQWQISTAGGIQARWRHDGKELYYLAPDGRLMAAPLAINGATLEPGTPVPLFRAPIVGGGTNNTVITHQYDVAADGRFLMNVTTGDAVTSPITLLMNWTGKEK